MDNLEEVLITSDVGVETTLKIIDKVKCPVIVVPSEAEFDGIKRITFAYDNKRIKEPANLNILMDYVNKFDARLEVLNINSQDSAKEENVVVLEESLKGIEYDFTTIQSDDISEGILDYLKGKPTDVLVALKRDHGFMEKVFRHSVTKKLILHTELPLMVLHES